MDNDIAKVELILGMEVKELIEVKHKLDVLGINIKDVKEFLDRDKSQLFAELKTEISMLKRKLHKIRIVAK